MYRVYITYYVQKNCLVKLLRIAMYKCAELPIICMIHMNMILPQLARVRTNLEFYSTFGQFVHFLHCCGCNVNPAPDKRKTLWTISRLTQNLFWFSPIFLLKVKSSSSQHPKLGSHKLKVHVNSCPDRGNTTQPLFKIVYANYHQIVGRQLSLCKIC